MAGRNEVELIFRARDEASQATSRIDASLRHLQTDAARASQSMAGLTREGTGWWRNVLQMTVGMAAGQAAFMAFDRTVRGIIGTFRKGIDAIDEFQQSTAAMAAAIASLQPEKPFEEVYELSGQIAEKVEELDRAFIGTGRELQILADAMLTYNLGINLANESQEKHFVALANTIKIVTRGQDFQRQAMQEIRALAEGQNVQGALLVKKLEAAGVNVKKMVPLWVEQGTLVENIVKYLGGYEKVGTRIENTLGAQKSSLETIATKVLREAMAPAYEDILEWVKEINKALYDEQGLTEDAKILVDLLAGSWDLVKTVLVGIGETLRLTVVPLTREMYQYAKKTKELQSKERDIDPFGISPAPGSWIWPGWDDKERERLQKESQRGPREPTTVKGLESFYVATGYTGLVVPGGKTGGEGDERAKRLQKLEEDVSDAIWDIRKKRAEREKHLEELAADAIWGIRKDLSERTKREQKSRLDAIADANEKELQLIARQREEYLDWIDQIKELKKDASEPLPAPWDDLLERDKAAARREFDDLERTLERKRARNEITPEQYDELYAELEEARADHLRRIEDLHAEHNVRMKNFYADLASGMHELWRGLFTDAFRGELEDFSDYFEAFTEVIRTAWANMVADMLADWMDKMMRGGAMDFIKGVGNFLSPGKGVGGAPVDEIAALDAFYTAKHGAVFPGPFMPIRGFQAGGIVDRPMIGMIGEGGGPEAVIPLRHGRVPVEIMGGQAEGGFKADISIVAMDAKDVRRMIFENRQTFLGMMVDEFRRGGGMRDTVRRYGSR